MEQTDCVVIGAGVVGLAIARELAARGRETLVLEAADAIGTGTSSRSSEVIHAGLYYPRGSLKAMSCVHGRDLLYEFCDTHHVPHRRTGKLLVATSAAQVKQLAAIAARAEENGVLDLLPLSRTEAQALEPELECVQALFSPSTGIVDSHQLMLALLGDAERNGAFCVLKSPVESIDVLRGARFVVRTGGDAPTEIEAACVINGAGLGAQALARRTHGLDPRWVPPLYLARGNYFNLAGRSPFRHLIYPMPDRAGLGVHLTLDLAGQARFGPDVEWIDALRYDVDPARADAFYASVRAFWPGLPDGALQPAYAGIRPKIAGPGESEADFVVQGAAQHGVRGLVNLFGIESPGLTASLALAQRIGEMTAHG
ncbi:NAD(P)/FAD-dependent oxidoreductase [Burkholderia guangdongensis]|uniref:NAD(P)/FAD-dependent oxidoreductase n=1 Tax=Burkholderia guangdongensis TaxID=1792500 RepID=UPI0015C88884|nr:NAD(P)/FAD-dependent oxidoreductase [Burkholderia guangdongensis]